MKIFGEKKISKKKKIKIFKKNFFQKIEKNRKKFLLKNQPKNTKYGSKSHFAVGLMVWL